MAAAHSADPVSVDTHNSTKLDELPALLTPRQFQVFTQLSRGSVYDLLRRRAIPGVLRFGRSIRIPRESITSFRAE
jgi:hypothetical protein